MFYELSSVPSEWWRYEPPEGNRSQRGICSRCYTEVKKHPGNENKVLASEVKKAGHGLVAGRDYAKGSVVDKFAGEIVRKEQWETDRKKGETGVQLTRTGALKMDMRKREGKAKKANTAEKKQINTRLVVDRKAVGKGGKNAAKIVATREIKMGQEIFTSYGRGVRVKKGNIIKAAQRQQTSSEKRRTAAMLN